MYERGQLEKDHLKLIPVKGNENPKFSIFCDGNKVKDIMESLIDNAIKFCKEGDYINIIIRTDQNNKVEISITDSGEGIKNDELPYIFDRYYKGKNYSESTGLGLAIVKKIIDLHNSVIRVTSQPGKGTAFTFYLPVAAA